MQQLELNFTTSSPINIESIKGQNKRLFDYLNAGNTITMFEARCIGIGYLNSRLSDLRNKCGIIVYDRMIKRNGTNVKEYSLTRFKT